jgi:hypothetical protein
MEFECRFVGKNQVVIEEKTSTAVQRVVSTKKQQPSEHHDSRQTNEKIAKSTAPCLIDLLSLRIRLFHDSNFFNEIKIVPEKSGGGGSTEIARNAMVEYSEQVHVQFSVFHSDKLAEYTELRDKLKHFHLTLERCWLTRAKEDSHVLQTLIING